jgi:hypothetical protein
MDVRIGLPGTVGRSMEWRVRAGAVVGVVAAALAVGACSTTQSSAGVEQTARTDSANSVVPTATAPVAPSTVDGASSVPADVTTSTPTPDSTSPQSSPPVPATTLPNAAPINVGEGTILGIGPSTPFGTAVAKLPALANPTIDGETTFACLTPTFAHHWVSRLGGLVLVWEGQTLDDAVLTNWQYTQPTPGAAATVVARDGVTVGSSRNAVVAAYPNAVDLGATIDVADVGLRFGLSGTTVIWFGHIACGP